MPEQLNQSAAKTDANREILREHVKEQLVEAQTGLRQTNEALAARWDRKPVLKRELDNLYKKEQSIRHEIVTMESEVDQLIVNRNEYHKRIRDYDVQLTRLKDEQRNSQRIQL